MPRRYLTSHKVNGANEALTVEALDEAGPGGASHHYGIGGFIRPNSEGTDVETYLNVHFQNGAIGEVGTNGVTHEALLAILIDRLQGFQSGKFACRENALALTKLQEAQMWLKSRTEARLARGVEGTLKV
ncbi:DUF7681 family protein [Singulisphaera sp. PoT]|uniref:Acb2/Tad1 domain-containing protein n=1 Tax=Singulisphaera sp. PoT TaxID=3411797 RepID=UPI003BF4C5B7